MRLSTTSPFAKAAEGFSNLAVQLNSVRGEISTLTYSGSGSAADRINENIENHLSTLTHLEEQANTTAETANRQAEIDAELAGAPTEEEIEELKRRWLDLKRKAADGDVSEEELEQAQKEYLDAKKEREEALKKHAEDTEAHKLETDDEESNGDDGYAPEGGASGGGSSSGGSSGGDLPAAASSSEGGLAGDTELSSDTAAGAGFQTPMMGQPMQPQMQPMQPQAAAGGAQAAAPMFNQQPTGQQYPQGFKSPKPNLPPPESDPFGRKRDPLAFLNRANGPSTSVSGTGGGAISDTRGISVSGVTTKSDVTGAGGTQLSSTTGQAPGTNSQGQQGAPMRGGMMGMGPMMAGAGGGAGNKTKERPDIKSQDRDLLGKDSLDQAVEGGMIGRSTSAPTTGEGGAR